MRRSEKGVRWRGRGVATAKGPWRGVEARARARWQVGKISVV